MSFLPTRWSLGGAARSLPAMRPCRYTFTHVSWKCMAGSRKEDDYDEPCNEDYYEDYHYHDHYDYYYYYYYYY